MAMDDKLNLWILSLNLSMTLVCKGLFYNLILLLFTLFRVFILSVYPNLPEEGCLQSFLSLLRERALCALY